MFALSNLARHGMDNDHPRALRCWFAIGNGTITDVLPITTEGMAMPQCPTFGPDDWNTAAKATSGIALIGIIGPARQARAYARAAGLERVKTTLDRDEPFMAVDLSNLAPFTGPERIIPLADAPRQTVFDWMTAYQVEALGSAATEARQRAEQGLAAYLAAGSHVVLVRGETPLAMTGFNARLENMVQIGGVYTPPELRNRGYARQAVVLHLMQARGEGVTRAVLFSASAAAARAYHAIGFRQTGDWTLCLFDGPQVVRHG